MRAVIQRVNHASVSVDGQTIAAIDKGLAVLIGVAVDDTMEDVAYMSEKLVNLRIFEDKEGKMNKSIKDINASLLIVSQFTLLGDIRKGRRPSFTQAAPPKQAEMLYEALVESCKQKVKVVQKGKFQAKMLVTILNDGPVTILLDSRKKF
ncbi:MAG: D-aminoacyl-tRNA deacylase [Tepidanaerobacteraceae bacterium]|nr:D-aminoacyl-tRNA deacylase [Tepidanaerobacteraceae bacterium]